MGNNKKNSIIKTEKNSKKFGSKLDSQSFCKNTL
jgi:hypothetical protein